MRATRSRFRGTDEHGEELLVFLHGRSPAPSSNLTQSLFDALHKLGPRAPAVLLADGGDHSYWHDRSEGEWGTYMLREAIPAAMARSGADRRRVAIGGISMGGFGALDLARIDPARFCAVGAHSAALWFRGADTRRVPSTTHRTSPDTTCEYLRFYAAACPQP